MGGGNLKVGDYVVSIYDHYIIAHSNSGVLKIIKFDHNAIIVELMSDVLSLHGDVVKKGAKVTLSRKYVVPAPFVKTRLWRALND